MALARTDLDRVKVRHHPRLLSDSGPWYLSCKSMKDINWKDIYHIRGARYHPINKIDRYHRSLKNVIKLKNYEYPWEHEQAIDEFIEYYDKPRHLESLENLTPEDA